MPVMAGSRSTIMSPSGHCAVSPLHAKNFLFLGSDGGGERAYTVLESVKPNGLDPQAWLSDVIDSLARGHPINRLSELLPWNWETKIVTLAA